MKPKKPRKKPAPIDPGAALLHSIMDALMQAQGRGGLTWLAGKLGAKSPSAMRKRLASPVGAFDPITLRAALLAISSKAEHHKATPSASVTVGPFIVDLHKQPDGSTIPAWRPK